MNKKTLAILVFLSLCFLSLFIFMNSVAKEEADVKVLPPMTPAFSVEIGDLSIPVELADTDEERRLGLSFRKKLDENSGMLFVMPKRDVTSFWMKDMQFPLDIIWIDGDRVVKIHRDLPPEGSIPSEHYSSVDPVDYVLELNGGFAQSQGIEVGDFVKLNIN